MAELAFDAARRIATALVTIGHPYEPAAITATAHDLVKWCRGAIIANRVWSPEDQADALVDEARTGWDEGWPRQGGTPKILNLFLTMFPPKHQELDPDWKPLSYEETVAKGLIRPPCEMCDDHLYIGEVPNLRYCVACPAGRHAQQWDGQRGLDRLNHPATPRPKPTAGFALASPISPEQMKRALEDEQRRRRSNREWDQQFAENQTLWEPSEEVN